jgi:hypothetical protein
MTIKRLITNGFCGIKAGRFGVGSTASALTTSDRRRITMAKRVVRSIRIEGNIAYVPLTKGYEAIIDAADAEIVGQFNWHVICHPTVIYAARNIGKSVIALHRVLIGPPLGFQVDHIDGNGLNNIRSNLRLATPSQNTCNSRRNRLNTSGFKGVRRETGRDRWRAQIQVNKIKMDLGMFESPEAAYAAYCAASERFHGEYGRVA